METAAISLNGNGTDSLLSLSDGMQPSFESFLDKAQEFAQGLDLSNMSNMLEKFNTGMDAVGLVKNMATGNVPQVLQNLSGLAETFFEQNAAAEQAAEMAQAAELAQSAEVAQGMETAQSLTMSLSN